MFFRTGIDQGASGPKSVTILCLPGWPRFWVASSRFSGKKIQVVPAQNVLVKTIEAPVNDSRRLKKYLQSEILLNYPGKRLLWSFKKKAGFVQLVLMDPPEGAFAGREAVEAEPLALARVFLASGFKDGYVLDVGKSKTTLVELADEELKGFRCLLRGCAYIDSRLAQERGLSLDKAERYRKEKGLEDPVIRQLFEETLAPLDINPMKILLLSGGGSRTKGLEGLFPKNIVSRNPFVPEELSSALGAALGTMIGKGLPSFEIDARPSPEFLKRALVAWTLALGVGLFSMVFVKGYSHRILAGIQRQEVALFKKHFPGAPVVSPARQLRALKERLQTPRFSARLAQALEGFPPSVRLFRLSYQDADLKIAGEAPASLNLEDMARKIGGRLTSIKEIPGDRQEFVLEINDGKT